MRALGTSNMSVARLKASLAASKALGIPRYESLQPNYNLYDRVDFESRYAPIRKAEGLGVITYYSLAGGFLTGKCRSAADAAKNPSRSGKVKGYFDVRGQRILQALHEVAARHNATPAQAALAWLIAQPGITAPISSATSLKQLAEILQAPGIKLARDDIIALDKTNA